MSLSQLPKSGMMEKVQEHTLISPATAASALHNDRVSRRPWLGHLGHFSRGLSCSDEFFRCVCELLVPTPTRLFQPAIRLRLVSSRSACRSLCCPSSLIHHLFQLLRLSQSPATTLDNPFAPQWPPGLLSHWQLDTFVSSSTLFLSPSGGHV